MTRGKKLPPWFDLDSAQQQIADLIRTRRIILGYTQRQLGEMCGYTGRSAEVSVYRWENARAPIPMKKLRPLAKALNVSVECLIPEIKPQHVRRSPFPAGLNS